METCKNCSYWDEWEKDEKHLIDVRVCTNTKEINTSDMKLNDFGIITYHDTLIYTGSDFGCVNFEDKHGR